jgi:hypothetical protein
MKNLFLLVMVTIFSRQLACASQDEIVNDASTKGIQFTASTTNSIISSNDEIVIHCVIKNTTTNRAYFYPWEPKVSTQVFAMAKDGKTVRLTRDDYDSYEGGPTFTFGPESSEEYDFMPPSSSIRSPGSYHLFCEMRVYFDESKSEIQDHGLITHKIRSNPIEINVK